MIGHEWAAGLLKSHIVHGSVRHAYLFTGADGLGKRTLALRFAQALNCETPPKAGEMCGECRACQLTWKTSYPDLHILQAEDEGKAIEVDQVRSLQRSLALAPYEAAWRVGLLLRFHEATISAANALLKTLEEPAAKVVLLLTARSVESVLPTIASRCEILRLRSLPSVALEGSLVERGVPEEQANLLAGLSGGRPGRALLWADAPEILRRREEALEDMLNLVGANRVERFAYVDSLTRGKQELRLKRTRALEVLEAWLTFWRDVTLLRSSAEVATVNQDREADLQRVAQEVDADSAADFVRALERTRVAIGKNANLRLALESLMLRLPHLRRV